MFDDVPATTRIAQEEIFGPVLAITRARDFEDALRIANGTDFGLTGAVFTKNAAKLQRAREEFFLGNLYLNRKCTCAMVGCHDPPGRAFHRTARRWKHTWTNC